MKIKKEGTPLEVAIRALYNQGYGDGLNVSCQERDGKWYVTVVKEYDAPSFKDMSFLVGMQKIAEVLGCKNLDIEDNISRSGCETCDWGSEYGYRFVAWNDEDDNNSLDNKVE